MLERTKQEGIKPQNKFHYSQTIVKANGKVSSGHYAAKFGGVTKTASRHLNELVDEGILDREGEKKGTRYFLKK